MESIEGQALAAVAKTNYGPPSLANLAESL